MGNANEFSTECAETPVEDGIAFIEGASPLTRLHYFDGKFLKADALSQEQAYHRTRVQLSNVAGGWGVVHGLGIDVKGNELFVTGGLAITPAGNFVMSVSGAKASLDDLIKVAEKAPPEGNADFQPCLGEADKGKTGNTTTTGLQVYEITVGPIDALCGNEPVYGKLCESACVSDSRHPWWREGLVLRLRPISLKLPTAKIPLTTTHLRNRIASAYFTLEPGSTHDLLSRAGLQGDGWCGTASLYGRDEVAIGLLMRDGSTARFDSWAARRERMDSQARGYWQGRMAMRPWNVYLAQILQFQCQLSGLLDDTGSVTPGSDCDDLREALDKARKEIAALQKKYASSAKKMVERFGGKLSKADQQWAIDEVKGSSADLFELSDSLSKLDVGSGALPANRLLFNSGFQQLPPAGYLPVDPGKTDVAEQLQRMFGEGVRLHLRAARADVLPHMLEEAQHMQRISLTQGLDDPSNLEDVEVFIPDGEVKTQADVSPGIWWQTTAHLPISLFTRVLGDLDKGSTAKAELEDDAVAGASKAIRSNLSGMQRLSSGLRINRTGGIASQDDTDAKQDGLTRTEARADGSFGVTMAVGLDLLDREATVLTRGEQVLAQANSVILNQAKEMAGNRLMLLRDDAPAAAAPTSDAQMKEEVSTQQIYMRRQEIANYFSADIAKDPFSLTVGEEVAGKLEWASMLLLNEEAVVRQTKGTGTLTVEKRVIQNNQTLMSVLIELQATSTDFAEGQTPETDAMAGRVRMLLYRKGDGQTGVLYIEDAELNPETPTMEIDWDDAPRSATLYLLDRSGSISGTGSTYDASKRLVLLDSDAQPMASANDVQTTTGSAQIERLPFISLNALSGMPSTSTAIGASALNVLVTIADVMNDAAFLARARGRLFPKLDQSAGFQVKALHDWVMFRRQRPNFCCDVVPVKAPESVVEAFQVWHLKAKSLEQVGQIKAALKAGDNKYFIEFPPKRVGVLRYRDDNTTSEEGASREVAMWKQAKPGEMVALARVWEGTPEAGQGWQNHFRVREMLQDISALTKPPAQGSGAIAVLDKVPATLQDNSLDGGIFIVTVDEIVTVAHRVITASIRRAEELHKQFTSNPNGAWKQLQEMMANPSTGLYAHSAIVHFDDAVLRQSDEALIKKAYDDTAIDMVGQVASQSCKAIRLDAASLAADVKPLPQHQAICKVIGATDLRPGGMNAFQLSSTDLGGAQVVTLVFVDADPQIN
ncbi:MAG: hypothetical protein QM742_12610, partial [Aquabacterium sp.]